MTGIELRTPRLTLTGVGADDAAFVLELLNDPGWLGNIGDRGVRTLEGARAYIRDRFSASLWLAARDAEGVPLGLCGLVERPALAHPDIGYAFLARHAGKGYATEAAGAVLRHALGALGHSSILAITKPSNAASQRVLAKIGLRNLGLVCLVDHGQPSALFAT